MDSQYLNILIFFGVFFVVISIRTYNRFIKYKNIIEERWSGIDIALKRRFNLIPNMVNAVKMYNTHEADTYTKTTEARHNSSEITNRTFEESAVTQSFQGLLAVTEAYPDLKSSKNFLSLHQSLQDFEKKFLTPAVLLTTLYEKTIPWFNLFQVTFLQKYFLLERLSILPLSSPHKDLFQK